MIKRFLNSILKRSLFFPLLAFSFTFSFSQTPDSTQSILVKEKHSARKATIYSAILPGLGQYYNKKAWKIPIVYAVIGGCLYTAVRNNQEYVTYYGELIYRKNHIGNKFNDDLKIYSDNNLLELANYHRKWRDNFYIFIGLAHLLNVIDANVDAHFFNFDASENLSLNIKPYTFSAENNSPVLGISLKLSFK